MSRKVPDDERRKWIRKLCTLLTVSGADNELILRAIDNADFRDFEDALQDCCAGTFHADYTITANTKDFKGVSRCKDFVSAVADYQEKIREELTKDGFNSRRSTKANA